MFVIYSRGDRVRERDREKGIFLNYLIVFLNVIRKFKFIKLFLIRFLFFLEIFNIYIYI